MTCRLVSMIAASTMVLAMASGCATLPDDPEERAEAEALNDPLEPTNRTLFRFNAFLDETVMEPVAEGYRSTFPDWFREAIHNFLVNIEEPYVAGNDLLQGNVRAAADALGRFMINSTFGLLGFRDAVADSGGPRAHSTDLGVTLAVWGLGEGPYLMLPLFGPSSLRDGTGRVADIWASPTGSVMASQGLEVFNYSKSGTELLDTRTQYLDPIKELRRTSLDQYAAIRSLYRQSRDAAIAASRRGQMTEAEARQAKAAAQPASSAPVSSSPSSSAPAPSSAPAAASSSPASPAAGSGTDPSAKPSAVEFVPRR